MRVLNIVRHRRSKSAPMKFQRSRLMWSRQRPEIFSFLRNHLPLRDASHLLGSSFLETSKIFVWQAITLALTSLAPTSFKRVGTATTAQLATPYTKNCRTE